MGQLENAKSDLNRLKKHLVHNLITRKYDPTLSIHYVSTTE